MLKMPKVSVIIPTYNRDKYIAEAINSVLSQTYQDFEIIIVDDGSTDKTKEVATHFVNKYPDKVKYLRQENEGAGSARNLGFKHSVGEYIADLVLDEKIIIELKTASSLTDIHKAQILNYLKATGYKLGILINFPPDSTGFDIERIPNFMV